MASLEFKSPKDGSVLRIQLLNRYEQEREFEVTVQTPWFAGRAPASTFMNGSPSKMFQAMANEWQGWRGAKSWKDLEDRVSLSGTTDSTGHVSVTVDLAGQDYDNRLRVVLQYDAGQLAEMASSVTGLLG